MRSAQEIQDLIVERAASDERIRAVLLNGSRANPHAVPDKLQDFDVVYVVTAIEPFTADHSWVDCFGERLIWQLPNEMGLYGESEKAGTPYSYLMLFEDGNRIDLSLVSTDQITAGYILESLTVAWLDKDGLFLQLPKATDSDFIIKRPTEKEFEETCNEFWWVSTYVAKGLARGEIPYAKHMIETVVRPMFTRIIEWYVGTRTDFSVSFGKQGKYMAKYIPKETYERVLSTYSDHQPDNNWNALATMTEMFGFLARTVADKMRLHYHKPEEDNIVDYIRRIRVSEN